MITMEHFDLDVTKIVKKLLTFANKRFSLRNWFIEVCFWNDTDYSISLKSSWGGCRNIFNYHKSEEKAIYYKERTIKPGHTTREDVETLWQWYINAIYWIKR